MPQKKKSNDEKVQTTASNLSLPVLITSKQGEVRWSAQSENSDERAFRVRRREAETVSRLRREEAETQHKLDEEKREADARRRNQFVGLCCGLGIVITLFATCTWIVFSKQYSPDVEKWATVALMSILTGSVTTVLGFAVGRATAK